MRVLFVGLACVGLSSAFAAESRSVSCLGRIEPLDGVYQLAGPSEIAVVSALRVEEGDRVDAGDVLAILDSHALRTAELKAAEVALQHAERALERQRGLRGTASVVSIEEAERDVQLHEAELVAARARRDRARVIAPVSGEVLKIHARAGERVGLQGILEIGRTDAMYLVAEVYETDIGLVDVGQLATANSPALARPISGKVERIGKVIGKSDTLDLDPVARMDSRVVEVFILLDEPDEVASLTNLQVDVEIHI